MEARQAFRQYLPGAQAPDGDGLPGPAWRGGNGNPWRTRRRHPADGQDLPGKPEGSTPHQPARRGLGRHDGVQRWRDRAHQAACDPHLRHRIQAAAHPGTARRDAGRSAERLPFALVSPGRRRRSRPEARGRRHALEVAADARGRAGRIHQAHGIAARNSARSVPERRRAHRGAVAGRAGRGRIAALRLRQPWQPIRRPGRQPVRRLALWRFPLRRLAFRRCPGGARRRPGQGPRARAAERGPPLRQGRVRGLDRAPAPAAAASDGAGRAAHREAGGRSRHRRDHHRRQPPETSGAAVGRPAGPRAKRSEA
ncbi:hypothetical protein D3C71_1428520 [compost metagenome]